MASAALNILSGIGAAAAGLAGEKVPKSGVIPGLDIAEIIPALLGKAGGENNLLGTIASVAAKSGLLNASNIGKIAELAGTLITAKAAKTPEKEGAKTKAGTAKNGIAELAAAIMSGTGTGASLASIASMALKLGKTADDEKSLNNMAGDLGKTLAGKFGVSFGGSAKAVSGLSKVLEDDTKTALFQSILKGIAK